MSLEKKYEDLTLFEIYSVSQNQLKKIVQESISSQLDMPQVLKILQGRVYSTFYSVKRLGIGYKISEFSITFKDSDKIIILDLLGLFIEISLNNFSISHYSIEGQSPRAHFSYSKYNEKIIIFGGKLLSTGKFLDDILIFDISDKTWISITLENPPVGRFLHSSCILGDLLIVYGGFGQKGWLRDLVFVNLQDLTCEKIRTRGFVSKAQNWIKAIAIKNDIYFFSGYEENSTFNCQMTKLCIRNLIGTLYNISVKDEVLMENVLSINCVGNEIVVVGISHNNICVNTYDVILDCWKRAKVFDDCELSIKHKEEEWIPVIFQNEVYLVHFYSVFSINI